MEPKRKKFVPLCGRLESRCGDVAEKVLPGDNIGEAIGKALTRSNAMVTLISPAAARSQLVTREIEFALTQPRYSGRVVPVMVKPTRNFPWILENLGLIDATGDMGKATSRVVDALKNPRKAEVSTN